MFLQNVLQFYINFKAKFWDKIAMRKITLEWSEILRSSNNSLENYTLIDGPVRKLNSNYDWIPFSNKIKSIQTILDRVNNFKEQRGATVSSKQKFEINF